MKPLAHADAIIQPFQQMKIQIFTRNKKGKPLLVSPDGNNDLSQSAWHLRVTVSPL